jgi:hypothetical protein
VDVWIIFYVGSGLEPKYTEKGKIELLWEGFSTCAAGFGPELLLGRPGLEGPAYDFSPPARRACGWRFYWGDRSQKALPKGYECLELKILAVSIVAFPH